MILGRGDKRLGLVVDGLRGQQEVVIKALDPAVSGAAFAIAGATIMGDGRVVLIVDVAALFEAAAPRAGCPACRLGSGPAGARAERRAPGRRDPARGAGRRATRR